MIGYYGALEDWIDTDLVADLAERRPDWRFVLVGRPVSADVSRLGRLPNVALPGEQPYAAIPGWLYRFDVAIIPFKRTPLTEATNPVKAYEVLAAGKPIVSVPIPEMQAMASLVRLASNAEEFERQVEDALRPEDPALIEARRAFAREHTWADRFAVLHHDHVRGVAAFDQHHRLLIAARGGRRADAALARAPEEPGDPDDQRQAGQYDQDVRRAHGRASRGRQPRSRLALVTTVTELAAIAAAAISGLSSTPKNGYSSPIATGMPRPL